MQRLVRHGGPAATTSSAKIWIPASANRLSHALSSALPWNFPDQELRPGKLIRTSGEYSASTGRMSPARRRAHTQFTSFEDSHERSISVSFQDLRRRGEAFPSLRRTTRLIALAI